MKFINRDTKEEINSDMMFINQYSDNGTTSYWTMIENIEKDFDIIV